MSNIQQENGKVMARLSQRISKSGGNEETDVLYLGESIVVYDEHESFIGVKYGDGVNKIKDLPWASVGEETVRQWIGEKPLVKETNINGEYLRLGNTNNPIFQVTSNGSTAEMTLNGKDVVTHDQLTGTVPTRKIVNALPQTLTKNYIYMIPIEGTDEYEEYIVVEQNGKLTAIKSGQDLSNYTTKTYVSKNYATKGELTTEKTELNKKINDTLIDIAEKLPTTVENYTDDQGISPFLGMSPDVALRQDVATANFHQVMRPFETAKTVEIAGNETVLNDADAIDAKVIQIETIEGSEIAKPVEGGGYQRLGSELCIGYNADERLRFYGYDNELIYLYGEQTLTHKGNGEYEINGNIEEATSDRIVSISEKKWAEPIIIDAESLNDGWYWVEENKILECKFKVIRPTTYHDLKRILFGDKITLDVSYFGDGQDHIGYFSCVGINGEYNVHYDDSESFTITFRLKLLEPAPDFSWIVNGDDFQTTFKPEDLVRIQYDLKAEETLAYSPQIFCETAWEWDVNGYLVHVEKGVGLLSGDLTLGYYKGNELKSIEITEYSPELPGSEENFYTNENNDCKIYLKCEKRPYNIEEYVYENYGRIIEVENTFGQNFEFPNFKAPLTIYLELNNPPRDKDVIWGYLWDANGESVQVITDSDYLQFDSLANSWYIELSNENRDYPGPYYYYRVSYYEDFEGESPSNPYQEFPLSFYKKDKKKFITDWSFEINSRHVYLWNNNGEDWDFYAAMKKASSDKVDELNVGEYCFSQGNVFFGLEEWPYPYYGEAEYWIDTWYDTAYAQRILESLYDIEQNLISKNLPLASKKVPATSAIKTLTVKYPLKYHKTPQESLDGDGLPLVMSINEVPVKRFKYKYWVYEPNKVIQGATKNTTARSSGSSWQEGYIEGATEYIVNITYSENDKLYAEASHVHLVLWYNNGYTPVIPMFAYRYNDGETEDCIGVINARFQFNKSNDESSFLTMDGGTHNTSLSPNGTVEYLSDAYCHSGNWTFNILASKI